jgi:hypothetical protein
MQTTRKATTTGTKAGRAGRAPRKRISVQDRAAARSKLAREKGRALLAKAFLKVHSPRGRVAARAWEIAQHTAGRIAARVKSDYEARGGSFPCAVFDYAEAVQGGFADAIARGVTDPREIIRAGCKVGNSMLRKMSQESATPPEDIPAYLPQLSAVEDAPCHWQRALVAKRARLLRTRAFAECKRRKAEGGRGCDLAARRGLQSDLKWIRRATRYMAAQIDGRGFSLHVARGVSPSGRCGGKARDERTPWGHMLRSFRRSAARLGISAAL